MIELLIGTGRCPAEITTLPWAYLFTDGDGRPVPVYQPKAELADVGDRLDETEQQLAAARGANRELMAQLNTARR